MYNEFYRIQPEYSRRIGFYSFNIRAINVGFTVMSWYFLRKITLPLAIRRETPKFSTNFTEFNSNIREIFVFIRELFERLALAVQHLC